MKTFAIQALRQIESSAQRGIWEAHRGCASLAGALLIKENLVDDDAHGSIRMHLESLLGSPRPEPAKASVVRRDDFVQRIVQELEIEAETPKEIGHDVIYSSYVLRALDAFDIAPWDSLLEGLTSLIRLVKSSGPGWITVNGRNEVREPGRPAESDGRDYWTIFCDFERPLTMEAGDMQLGHLLTHGHAISMMRSHCPEALIRMFDIAYRRRLYLLAAANKEERDQTGLRREGIDPRLLRYWTLMDRFGDMHGHIFKYGFSFLDLRRNGIGRGDLEAFGRIVWPTQPAALFEGTGISTNPFRQEAKIRRDR